MKCPRCNGRMRVPSFQKNLSLPFHISDDGMMPCPECEGEGEIECEHAEVTKKGDNLYCEVCKELVEEE